MEWLQIDVPKWEHCHLASSISTAQDSFLGWSTSVPLFTYWSLTTLFYWTIKSLSYWFSFYWAVKSLSY
ncbi:hypothetical protein T09_8929 [Trichinella sp. T9]|nr:hypothetical protein T09_8929 [Trichinella sp. T9]